MVLISRSIWRPPNWDSVPPHGNTPRKRGAARWAWRGAALPHTQAGRRDGPEVVSPTSNDPPHHTYAAHTHTHAALSRSNARRAIGEGDVRRAARSEAARRSTGGDPRPLPAPPLMRSRCRHCRRLPPPLPPPPSPSLPLPSPPLHRKR